MGERNPSLKVASFQGKILESTQPKSKKKQKCERLSKHSDIAIIGTGPSGLSVALSLQQAGFLGNITLYERDSHFQARKEGYGLTLTYNPSKSSPLQKLGLLEQLAREDCPSRSHYVFDSIGNILGYYGNDFSIERGYGQRGNLRVPRQTLRRIMMKALLQRNEERDGKMKIEWGKKLASYEHHRSRDSISKPLTLRFQDGTRAMADLLIGADGVNSTVLSQLLSSPINAIPGRNVDNIEVPSKVPSASLSYIGVFIVVGITTNFFHPLLDERGFYTLDGTHRLFTMPFEGSRLDDLAFESNYNNSEGKTSRRYMWQLSYQLDSEEEARKLVKRGPEAILEEVMSRTQTWHDPVPKMIRSTPLKTIWGTPLMDRDPTKILHEMKRLYNPDKMGFNPKGNLRVVVMGDAVHPMSPFKGQGCNQALADGPLLSSWLERSVLDSAVMGFMREMVNRTSVRVKASREAACFLHSKAVLTTKESFAGVSKDFRDEFIRILRARNINALLGKFLDRKVSDVMTELKVNDNTSKSAEADHRDLKNCALKFASIGDTASLRILSTKHPSSIRDARCKDSFQGCLHLAANFGCYWTCRWLLSEVCCDYNQLDNRNRSPLHCAVIEGNIDVTRLLTLVSKSSAPSWGVDCDGNTPLDYAARHKNEDLRRQLMEVLS